MLHLVYGTNSPLISASLVRQSPALSPITHGSSSSSPSSLSPLSSSLTRSVFHSELKRLSSSANLFLHGPFLSYWTDSTHGQRHRGGDVGGTTPFCGL